MYRRQIDNTWNFREANTKEYTHCYHIYPAMMIPQIARTLIQEYRPKGKCELLFDPYMGSGTTLVEASLAHINSVGIDLNPLARLIAKTKTTFYNEKELENEFQTIRSRFSSFSRMEVEDKNFERISNFNYWYTEENLFKLSFLSQLIKTYSRTPDFFNVALAEVIREVSFTRNSEFKRFRMKEDKIKTFHPNVFGLFEEKVWRNIEGLNEFVKVARNDISVRIHDFDTTLGIPSTIVGNGSVDMIITSPPYGDSRTTVAYGQFSRWANEWFSFENARNLDSLLMGGKKCNQKLFFTESINRELQQIYDADIKRYYEVVSFLNDYWFSIQNVAKTVRKGGIVCYVVGNRNVKGVQIPLDYFTAESFERCGFHHIVTIVRKIPNKRMPLKASPTNLRGIKIDTMNKEYIVILEK